MQVEMSHAWLYIWSFIIEEVMEEPRTLKDSTLKVVSSDWKLITQGSTVIEMEKGTRAIFCLYEPRPTWYTTHSDCSMGNGKL